MEKFAFLKSNRFWALVVGAVIVYLNSKQVLGEAELKLALAIIGPFIGVRTIDRLGEKIGK